MPRGGWCRNHPLRSVIDRRGPVATFCDGTAFRPGGHCQNPSPDVCFRGVGSMCGELMGPNDPNASCEYRSSPSGPPQVDRDGFGIVLFAFALLAPELPRGARWIVGLGGVILVLVGPAAARSMVSSIAVTEEGVTGAGFLAPVHIPWAEVVRVCDDSHGIDVQSATHSARIDISSVTVRGPAINRQVGNFNNPDEIVRFILAHVPKSALLELNHWMPT